MPLEWRFENPPTMKVQEGGPEPHTPGTGRAPGPPAQGKGKQPGFAGSQQECKV